MSPLHLFAACAPGLEPLLAEEARSLGATRVHEVAGGVELLHGETELAYRGCLELGVASHLLVRIAQFPARTFEQLVRETAALGWRDWLAPGAPVAIRTRTRGSRLYHTKAIAERVRRGLGQALGGEPPDATDRGAPAVHLRLVDDLCTVSLDLSGEPLHRRGYRWATGKAPLREDLARALVRVSGWDGEGPLVDPFMGSGTLVIEAALLARGLPPGGGREHALMRLPWFDAARWDALRERVLERAQGTLPAPLFGSDRDAGAVEAAEANAQRAGVSADLRLAQAALTKAPAWEPPLPPRGALVTNPPHGQRVGRKHDLRPLYQALGRLATGLPQGWSVALLADDRRLAMSTGLKLRTAVLTDSGGTKVRMLTGR